MNNEKRQKYAEEKAGLRDNLWRADLSIREHSYVEFMDIELKAFRKFVRLEIVPKEENCKDNA